MKKKILIIGAGPGGLTAGMILAARGFDVHIYEKAPVVGGRSAEIKQDGFTFDVGPTFLMLKSILDEVFVASGEKVEDHMKFTRLDPMYRLMFEEFSMDISDDTEKMKKEIAKHFPGQEEGLDRFMAREAKRYAAIAPIMQKSQSSFWNFFTPVFLKALPHMPIGQSIFQFLGKYFKPEKLRLAFTFQAKYLGMSPFECPGFFIIIPFIEHAYGIFHVEGGLSVISKKMAEITRKKGGSIHLGAPIRQIICEGRKAVGVELMTGEKVYGDEVIINADFAHAMNTLVPPHLLKKYTPAKLAKKKYSCSTFMIYLGVKGEYPELAHHNILFSHTYEKNMVDIFKDFRLSDDFSVYLRNATVTDKTLAPAGMSNIYLLVPMPNMKANVDWDKEKSRIREMVLDVVEKRTPIKNIRSKIVTEHIITPADWEKAGVYRGAVFNLAHSFDQLLMLRPHNKFEELDNVYLVGGGTHPGSGLPTIYQSGIIAADLISEKYQNEK